MENDYPKIVEPVTPKKPVSQDTSNIDPLFESILQPFLFIKNTDDDS